MKKEEIHLWDIQRILFGQAPPQFLLEVFIRSLIVYIATIIIVRWMGKRMNGQLTLVEMSVMIMMGAIISVPMQVPDRGILQGLLVLLVTLFCLRSINWIAFKKTGFEKLVQRELVILIEDGVLQTKELAKTKLTNQQVFEVLGSKKIFQLGKVERMYLEACGIYSIYQNKEAKAGLPLYPPTDKNIYKELKTAELNKKACTNCGQVYKPVSDFCTNCGNNEFTKAIV